MISEEIATLPTPINHWFGVGITTSENYNHCGVVFIDTQDNERKIFNLAFHNILCLGVLKESYKWVRLTEPFDEDNARDFAHHCKWIASLNKGNVPYGIKYDKALINPSTGLFELNDGEGVGVTCSTWTMLVFKSFGIDLVNTDSWEVRKSDSEWHNWIIEMLIRYNVSQEHIKSVRLENPCVRIRPEEIAASCSVENKPAVFSVVEPLGKIIHNEIRAY